MEIEYCWRVDKELPTLDENEWNEIAPYLDNTVKKIKEYRELHNCDISTARRNCSPEAVKKYEELTGYNDIDIDILFYLRRRIYGPKCNNCGKLFRTPKARFCADCGQTLEQNSQ